MSIHSVSLVLFNLFYNRFLNESEKNHHITGAGNIAIYFGEFTIHQALTFL